MPSASGFFPTEQHVPEPFRLPAPLDQREYLINGQILTWDGPMQEVLSAVCLDGPDGPQPKRLGRYPLLTDTESLAALDAAAAAYDHGRGPWPTMSVHDRVGHVAQFISRMKETRDEVVRMLLWEIGKSHASACKEFDRTIEYVLDTIDALKDLDRKSSRFEIIHGVIGQVRRAPLGVVLCMGPYNYPLNETFTTLIPALIMGNTAIFKPPKLGVLLHQPLLELYRDCFPPGVVNTVYGDGRTVVGPMMTSGKVNCLAFIGSSNVADLLRNQHPKPHQLRCVLGLGAKNPAIVLPDADLDQAVGECALGSLSYNGQRCTAIKIIFVHSSIVEQFVEKLCTTVAALPCGMPWDEGVQLTPLPEPGKPEALAEYVADAVARGAEVVNGGGTVDHTFFHPAVVYPVKPGMTLWTVEQFGPVIPVTSFDDIEEPIHYMMASEYGQQAAVFGKDPAQIARLVDPLVNQVCRLNINSQCQRGPDAYPFTGRKSSAEGTLSVTDALRVFAIRTMVAAKDTDLNKDIITTITREHQSKFLSTDFIF